MVVNKLKDSGLLRQADRKLHGPHRYSIPQTKTDDYHIRLYWLLIKCEKLYHPDVLRVSTDQYGKMISPASSRVAYATVSVTKKNLTVSSGSYKQWTRGPGTGDPRTRSQGFESNDVYGLESI